jgi:hypothetical protein
MLLAPPEKDLALAGYSFLISEYALQIPLPDILFATSEKHKRYRKANWEVLTPRHKPSRDLFSQLTFSLKYEGVCLWVLKALFSKVEAKEVEQIVRNEPTSLYSRKIWFLYEWLLECELDLPDLKQGNYTELVNTKLQFGGPERKEKRQRIINNLPGNLYFCPLVRRTKKLEALIDKNLQRVALEQTNACHSDLLSRAAAFLLLADTKASYNIEGEKPAHTRIERWGRIVAEAGKNALSLEELERLQSVVISDYRFVMPGLRLNGGFIGNHDRATGLPLPEHISARAEDLDQLMQGFFEAYDLLIKSDYPAVLIASQLAFGFVFIHPFEDGNGRLHRYLLHHILAESGFVPKGIVFPISAVILERIDEYRKVLENYSKPRLPFIEWRPTQQNNVEVVNDTLDLYRFFDATQQTEFLYDCVEHTIDVSLPNEVNYLIKHDEFFSKVTNMFDMPDRLIDLLIRFLQQNDGLLSKRAQEKEFSELTSDEIILIEQLYSDIFILRN